MHLIRRLTWKESGQILVLYALVLPLILLCVGVGVDFGFAFLTKANLAKAADAASLAVMRNLGQGQTQAKAIGQSMFALNANSKLYASAPSAIINIATGANGEPIVNVSASGATRAFFLGFAGFHTLNVGTFSQVTRPPIVLPLVLDHSGSMTLNGGSTALPPAVTDFLGYFIEGTDQVGEISFGSTANVDVPVSTTFKSAIQTSMATMPWGGATYAQGGLLDAQAQITGSNPATNAVEVVVFFTDGWANTNEDTLGGSLVNYGGCSPVEQTVGWCSNFFCINPTTGNTISYTNPNSGSCNGVTQFTPHDTTDLSNPAALNITNVSIDAKYRAVQLANSMRAAGITVYSIGLGDKIDTTYLQELANDPASPVYNPNLPSGVFENAPTSADLERAFQTVASKIILRLTQ